MKTLIPLLIFLLPAVAFADYVAWLKKDNSNELIADAGQNGDCISGVELNELIDGLMIRSRIKRLYPTKLGGDDNLTLRLVISCLKIPGGEYVFHSDVEFVRYKKGELSNLLRMSTLRNYGTTGIGNSAFLRKAVKDAAEQAITDYLKANFDLAE